MFNPLDIAELCEELFSHLIYRLEQKFLMTNLYEDLHNFQG
jgi:hypothetical protein